MYISHVNLRRFTFITGISLVVEKCLLLDDPRLPKLKIAGQLPSIHLDVVDTR